jgi:hypothetical protein
MNTVDIIKVTGWYVVRTITGFNTVVRLVRDDSFRSLEIVDGPFAYRPDADAALKNVGL